MGYLSECRADTIGTIASRRAGKGSQLKGVVHEVAYVYKQQTKPSSLLGGKHIGLTSSATSQGADIICLAKNGDSSGYQLKDITSESGLRNLRRRLDIGHYESEFLVGTKETAEMWRNFGHPRQMDSSGISTKYNLRVADNAGANVRSKNPLRSNLTNIGHTTARNAAANCITSSLGAALQNFPNFRRGELDLNNYIWVVLGTGIKTGAEKGITTILALVTKESVKEVGKRINSEALRTIAGGTIGTNTCFALAEIAVDGLGYYVGNITGAEFACRTTGHVGGALGGVAGANVGASCGSAFGPVGTVIGAVTGSMGGRFVGSDVTRRVTDKLRAAMRSDPTNREILLGMCIDLGRSACFQGVVYGGTTGAFTAWCGFRHGKPPREVAILAGKRAWEGFLRAAAHDMTGNIPRHILIYLTKNAPRSGVGRFARSNLFSPTTDLSWKFVVNTRLYLSDEISKNEYIQKTSTDVATTVGGITGARLLSFAGGALFGPWGRAVGTAAGFYLGSAASRKALS